MRVAALADVHGNAPALAAVLAEVEQERPDLVVFCGDLTWGSLPQETLALVRGLGIPARFVRGNADRMVGIEEEGRGPWMAAQHTDEDLAFLATFEPTLTVDVVGLGQTCFCHGSPRSDEECVTERTPVRSLSSMARRVGSERAPKMTLSESGLLRFFRRAGYIAMLLYTKPAAFGQASRGQTP